MSSRLTPEYMKKALASSGLRPGAGGRIRHDCGDGSPLSIRQEGGEVHFHCYRCKDWGILKLEEAPGQKLSRIRDAHRAREEAETTGQTPGACEYNFNAWPEPARLWLAKYGLGALEATYYGVAYNPGLRRVIFNIHEYYTWCARRIFTDDTGPKYLMPRGHQAVYLPHLKTDHPIVLCEDALSAVKLCVAGYQGFALLGTTMHPVAGSRLLKEVEYRRSYVDGPVVVYIWMDDDAAGKTAAASIQRGLSALNVPAHVVRRAKSPKDNTRDDINQILKEYL